MTIEVAPASPIERFHQQRNDQGIDGRVIKTRRIV